MSGPIGEYTCNECGTQWRARDRYVWWPIRITWSTRLLNWRKPRFWFGVWGWQIGWDGIEQRVFGRSIRLGPIVVKLGKEPAR